MIYKKVKKFTTGELLSDWRMYIKYHHESKHIITEEVDGVDILYLHVQWMTCLHYSSVLSISSNSTHYETLIKAALINILS